MLVDSALCAVFAALLYFTLTANRPAMYVCLALAPLIRETGLLFSAGFCVHQLIARQWKPAILCAASALPFLGWIGFVSTHTNPSDDPTSIFGHPVYGQLARLIAIRDLAEPSAIVATVVRIADAVSIAGLIVCLTFGLIWGIRKWRTAPGIVAVLFALMGWSLGTPGYLTEACKSRLLLGPRALTRGVLPTVASPVFHAIRLL